MMSRTFLPMMATCAAAVGVYYLCRVRLDMNGLPAMALGILAAVIISWSFSRWKRKKED